MFLLMTYRPGCPQQYVDGAHFQRSHQLCIDVQWQIHYTVLRGKKGITREARCCSIWLSNYLAPMRDSHAGCRVSSIQVWHQRASVMPSLQILSPGAKVSTDVSLHNCEQRHHELICAVRHMCTSVSNLGKYLYSADTPFAYYHILFLTYNIHLSPPHVNLFLHVTDKYTVFFAL